MTEHRPQQPTSIENTARHRFSDPQAQSYSRFAEGESEAPAAATGITAPRRWPKRAGIAVAVLLVCAVIAALALWTWPILKVDNVEVEGQMRVDPAQIVEASGVKEGTNLVRVDESAAAGGVASLPWVEQATVSRSLPGTVRIRVVEHEAVLFHREDGQAPVLIDAQGRAFLREEPQPGPVEATGQAATDPQTLSAIALVAAALEPGIRDQVARIDAPEAKSLELVLKDGRTIAWGPAENNHDKARAVRAVIGREGEHWDVTNPNLVTVR